MAPQTPTRASDLRALARRQLALPPRAWPVAAPTIAAGITLIAAAAFTLGSVPGPAVGLLVAATLAEAFPVPIEGVAAGTTSFSTIFIATAGTEYGWQIAALIGGLGIGLTQLRRRTALARAVTNIGLYALAGGAAGFTSHLLPGRYRIGLLSATTFYLIDVGLLSAIVARTRSARWWRVAPGFYTSTFGPFFVMASITTVVVRLWASSPAWAALIVPALATLVFYQRQLAGTVERQRHLDVLKDEFIATTSHELRTPLTSIYGSAVTLSEHKLDDATRTRLVDIIRDQSVRLTRLVEDVLWASRIASGGTGSNIENCEAGEIVADVVAAVSSASQSKIRVIDGGEVGVRADPEQLYRVLLNLVDNAIKYSPNGSDVEIASHVQDGRRVRIEVRDRGIGVPAADRERVFERFSRLDPATSGGVGGTGLGLYICRELVEGMGGRIWVEPRPGGGSTFALDLPGATG
jgi:signal transduction histidine kinase